MCVLVLGCWFWRIFFLSWFFFLYVVLELIGFCYLWFVCFVMICIFLRLVYSVVLMWLVGDSVGVIWVGMFVYVRYKFWLCFVFFCVILFYFIWYFFFCGKLYLIFWYGSGYNYCDLLFNVYFVVKLFVIGILFSVGVICFFCSKFYILCCNIVGLCYNRL